MSEETIEVNIAEGTPGRPFRVFAEDKLLCLSEERAIKLRDLLGSTIARYQDIRRKELKEKHAKH